MRIVQSSDSPEPVAYRRNTLQVVLAADAIADANRDAALRLDDGKPVRPHDLRHRFAVTRLALWHQQRADVQALLPLLATYLGHASYSDTTYYITGTAELLALAADRAFAGGANS